MDRQSSTLDSAKVRWLEHKRDEADASRRDYLGRLKRIKKAWHEHYYLEGGLEEPGFYREMIEALEGID